jgi:hypothetical protein
MDVFAKIDDFVDQVRLRKGKKGEIFLINFFSSVQPAKFEHLMVLFDHKQCRSHCHQDKSEVVKTQYCRLSQINDRFM